MNARVDALVADLKMNLNVRLITPEDAAYDSSRLVYNRMHDTFPQLIVQTLDREALRSILAFCKATEIPFAVRGGGHHIGGFSTCDGGIVIDFSPFRKVDVARTQGVVSVQPGARLADLDAATSALGVVVPTGTVSDTGVAGLTLGGGIGWLVGRLGLTCDFLCGADVLLASGEIVQAEAPEHADLLWALRGGGGNFGIVLEFRYRLSPLPKTICGSGEVSWENAEEVAELLFGYLESACPKAMSVAPVLCTTSGGEKVLRIDFCYSGADQLDVDKLLNLSHFIEWAQVKVWNFKEWQAAFDSTFLPPMRGYWKASYTSQIPSATRRQLFAAFATAPSHRCSILIEQLHGAFKEANEDHAAFPLRHANFGILISARWPSAAQDHEHIRWARGTYLAIDPQQTSATYSNYTGKEDARAARDLKSVAHAKITQVKTSYDPTNLFRSNHNILPRAQNEN